MNVHVNQSRFAPSTLRANQLQIDHSADWFQKQAQILEKAIRAAEVEESEGKQHHARYAAARGPAPDVLLLTEEDQSMFGVNPKSFPFAEGHDGPEKTCRWAERHLPLLANAVDDAGTKGKRAKQLLPEIQLWEERRTQVDREYGFPECEDHIPASDELLATCLKIMRRRAVSWPDVEVQMRAYACQGLSGTGFDDSIENVMDGIARLMHPGARDFSKAS